MPDAEAAEAAAAVAAAAAAADTDRLDTTKPVSEMGIWFRTPQPVRTTVLAAAWFGYGLLVSDLNFSALNSLGEDTRGAGIIWGASLAGLALTIAIDAGVHRRFGSAQEIVTYNSAMRSGELPGGIDVRQWHRRLRRSRVVVALGWIFFSPLIWFGCMSSASSQATYRSLPQWGFAIVGVVSLVVAYRRQARIKELESALTRRQSQRRAASFRLNEQEKWHLVAETSLASRFACMATMGTLFAFAAILLAGLDSIVYGDARGSHLLWTAIAAAAMGVAASPVAVADPFFQATNDTVDEMVRYDRALRTGELPEHLDAEVWRGWIRGHRRSTGALLLWAGFLWLVGCWSILHHPSGYHWFAALLLEMLAILQFLGWRSRRTRIAWLAAQVDRHARMQPLSNHSAPLDRPSDR